MKPPLSFLAIIAGYKLAGFNAMGLRILSACFAMFTIIMVGAFVYKKYGKLASVLSLLVLITSTQFLTNHSSRTGDADSLFVCLFTIAILALLLTNHNLMASKILLHGRLVVKGFLLGAVLLTSGYYETGSIII